MAVVLLASGCGLLQEVDDAVTVTVRNESDAAVQLEIIEAPDIAEGRPRTIAPAIGVEPGEQQVRIHPPDEQWAIRVRGTEGFLYSDDIGRRQSQLEAGTDFLLINQDAQFEGLVSGDP
jgi:hypothetical protein